jgi:hypothetical protein
MVQHLLAPKIALDTPPSTVQRASARPDKAEVLTATVTATQL